MTIEEKIRSVLGYRTLPTTVLLVLIYAISLTAVFVSSELGTIPHAGSKKLRGLDLRQARRDLEHIAARPHPYNSHANDEVRNYILHRLADIAWGRDYIHLEDDLRSNGSWASTNYGVYFEGTNVLLKIDGTDASSSDTDGILFSAHYDSVSTAPGATDDGMGVTTILQLAEYFAQNRPNKTAIFNINNGEEDWLNGAHAFMQHPWSNLTSTFLNLEGAAAGGQPILFRATSLLPLKAYKDVPHPLRVRRPHANVLSSDAFARGVIKSGTDYSVYTGNDRHGPAASSGLIMEGLDIAFYKGRSRYHTKWDGPAYTEGGDRSLWSMIDVARGVGVGLLNPKKTGRNAESKPGVYLDLFRSTLITFSLKNVLVFNIVTLIVGPIVLALLWAVSAVIHQRSTPPPPPPKPHVPHSTFSPSASASHHNASGRPPRAFGSSDSVPTSSPTLVSRLRSVSVRNVLISIWKQASFWVALGVTFLLQWLLVWGYVALNPFTIHSRPYFVLLSFFSLAYLSVTVILKAAFPPAVVKHTTEVREKEKTTILLHLHLFTWVALLVGTILIGKTQIGGVYALTVWYLGVWAAGIAGTLQALLGVTKTDKGKKRARRSSSASSSSSSSSSSDSEGEHNPTRTTNEQTPLLNTRANGSTNKNKKNKKVVDEGGVIGWWILQVLLTVPAVILLVGQIGVLLLDAMSQTLSDGSSAWTVYASTSALAVLLAIPVAPFTPKLHRGLTIVALVTFIATTAYLLIVFPFTSADPLKVFFQQRISLDHGDVFLTGLGDLRLPAHATPNANSEPKIITQLTGTGLYLKQVISQLPSSRDEDIECTPNKLRPGLLTCEWESKSLAPQPGGRNPWYIEADNNTTHSIDVGGSGDYWFKADVTRTGWTSARIVLQGRNTRNCRLYFDPPKQSGVKVVRYVVAGGAKGMQTGYPVDQANGLKEIRLWSRTWNRVWEVDVDWETPLETGDDEGLLAGKIACEWAEYQSGMVDNGSLGSDKQAKIPALEEALSYLPEWAVVTKAADGLVEAFVPFSL